MIVALALAAAIPAAAEPLFWRELTADDIARRFVGSTYEGVYPDGIRFSETIRPDLTVAYDADDGVQGGLFFLDGDEMCFRYTGGERAYCFIVWQRSANCYDGYVDPLPPEVRASAVERMLGLSSDVRFWRSDEPSTCPAQSISRPRSGWPAGTG